MNDVLNGRGLGLAYVSEFDTIAALDQARIYDDLEREACDKLAYRPERWRLLDHDHIVLARASDGGRYLGLLAACAGETGRDSYLHIETAFVSPAARGVNLFERMLAFALLRMQGADCAPAAVSVCTGNVWCLAALGGFADRLPGAVMYPQIDQVVALSTAAFARQVARQMLPRDALNLATGCVSGPREQVLAVLDLRGCAAADMTELGREICRARPTRAALRQLQSGPLPVRQAAGH